MDPSELGDGPPAPEVGQRGTTGGLQHMATGASARLHPAVMPKTLGLASVYSSVKWQGQCTSFPSLGWVVRKRGWEAATRTHSGRESTGPVTAKGKQVPVGTDTSVLVSRACCPLERAAPVAPSPGGRSGPPGGAEALAGGSLGSARRRGGWLRYPRHRHSCLHALRFYVSVDRERVWTRLSRMKSCLEMGPRADLGQAGSGLRQGVGMGSLPLLASL